LICIPMFSGRVLKLYFGNDGLVWNGQRAMTETTQHPYDGKKLISVTIAVVIIGFFILFSRTQFQPKIECYSGQTQRMTVQEVATLLKTPLVELTWLPQNQKIIPEIKALPFSDARSSFCIVNISYPKSGTSSQDDLVFLSLSPLGTIQPTKIPTRCSLQFSPDGPLGTDCSVEVDGMHSTLRVSLKLSEDFSPEDALKIIDGIRVVEPQE
jgi:hypothetical protein